MSKEEVFLFFFFFFATVILVANTAFWPQPEVLEREVGWKPNECE